MNLTLSLSKELAGTGITVNAVSPGLVKTQTVEAAYRQRAAQLGWGDEWNEIEQHTLPWHSLTQKLYHGAQL